MIKEKAIIDRFLEIEDPWSLPVGERRELLAASIREAVGFHYEHNTVWRRLCEAKGFRPSDVQTYDDLNLIPVISTRAFKGGFDLLSVPEEEIVKVHMSSGTSGNRSRVPRDRITLDRNERSLQISIRKFRASDARYLAMMSPSPDELGDLTMANYARTAAAMAEDHGFFLELKGGFRPEKVVETLNRVKVRPVNIGGAPVLIMVLAQYILKTGDRIRTLTPDSGVSSAGGFKTPTGDMISREEFDQLVMKAFGIPRENIRDVYSMSELNGALLECGHHHKHLPPWFYLSIRNPADIDEEVAPGEEGLPVFLDPLAHSYPGFIIADDIVSITTGPEEICACGVPGPVLAPHVRRAQGVEEKGCGRHVAELREQMMNSDENI